MIYFFVLFSVNTIPSSHLRFFRRTIKSKYGQGILQVSSQDTYLVNDSASDEYNDNGYQFLQNALSRMKEDEDVANTEAVLNDIVKFYQSFREMSVCYLISRS